MPAPRRSSDPLRLLLPVSVCAVLLTVAVAAQARRDRVLLAPQSSSELREWDQRIDRMLRDGDLRLRQRREDTLIAGRTHERLDQYYRGVRVFGADVTRQLDAGLTISTCGVLYDGIDVDTTPAVDSATARAIVEQRAGATLGANLQPELMVLPRGDGGFLLTWRLRAAGTDDLRQYFVDARNGSIALEYSDVKTQAAGATGAAHGVLGDQKKISVSQETSRYTTVDRRRPPAITTYDMQGNPTRTRDYLNFRVQLGASDLGADTDNNWTDGAVVDAHVYAGWTYDYYYRQFGRKGLDNANIAIYSLVHPVRRSDYTSSYYNTYPSYFANAGYYGGGIMVYGDGLPSGVTLGGQTWDYLSGSLDVVAHELTHGVTDYSSDLIYLNESGALNEAFSDIMGTSVEFFFQPPGTGSLHADYLLGEDVIRPGGLRSMADPLAYGDPDHYSRRYIGSTDNGGVHTNSGIANQAFYLAIEGGTNRTSGLSVQGVGSSNRAQIERVFYRAFTQLMTSSSTFATAYSATVQAARDLYGSGSAPDRAVTQAWAAVGVQPPVTALLVNGSTTVTAARNAVLPSTGWPAVAVDVRGRMPRGQQVADAFRGRR